MSEKIDALRASFEAWISLPPFEHSCERNEESSAWPWSYRLYATEIAWEAWQACHAAMHGEDIRRDAERYRWLKGNADEGVWISVGKVVSACDEYPQYENVCWLSAAEIDREIDKGMEGRHE